MDKDADLIILDEAIVTVNLGMLNEDLLKEALERWTSAPDDENPTEVVMTGRNPEPWMHEWADYDTEMRLVKHPYDNGLFGRQGIEL